MTNRNKAFLTLLALVVLALAAFSLWASRTPEPGEWARGVMTGDETYLVEPDSGWIRFIPQQGYRGSVVFYPGGKVSAESYAPLAASLASGGYEVFLLHMPLNMAFFDVKKAEKIMEAYPDRQFLAIGGHSLGGVAASAYWERSAVPGLFLLASYPSRTLTRGNPVLALFGSNDGLLSPEDRQAIKDRTPPDSIILEIEGGNHAQFGDYGPQKDDGQGEITMMEQNAQTFYALEEYLRSLNP